MTKQEFLEKLNYLIKKYNDYKNSEDSITINNIEQLIKDYLAKNPNNIDLHFKLASIYFGYDDYGAIKELEAVLCLDKNNFTAFIAASYMQYYFFTEIPEYTFTKLLEFPTTNNEEKSMIEFMKSIYYDLKHDKKKQEECLIQSINFCDKFVNNFIRLGWLYNEKNEIEKEKTLIKKSLKNIQKIIHENDFSDPTDINDFINYFIKGTTKTESGLARLQDSVK